MDARATVTTLSGYDGLNRPLKKSYNDGTPEVDYLYDTVFKGALSSVSATGVSSTSYDGYDSMRRVTQSTQSTQGQSSSFVFHYTYNAAGELELMTYPSQRQVKTCYEVAGRVQQVQNG